MSDAELIDYTDPDTIARQNIAPNAGCNIDGKFYDVRNLVHLASSQADRIEALTAKLATCEKYRDAYDECDRIGTQAVRDLEAKLAKAEAGLLAIAKRDEQMIWGEDYEVEEAFKDMRDIALATLADIQGESHE